MDGHVRMLRGTVSHKAGSRGHGKSPPRIPSRKATGRWISIPSPEVFSSAFRKIRPAAGVSKLFGIYAPFGPDECRSPLRAVGADGILFDMSQFDGRFLRWTTAYRGRSCGAGTS